MQMEWSKALHGDRNVVGTREKAAVMGGAGGVKDHGNASPKSPG